jgi:hypothetical protein
MTSLPLVASDIDGARVTIVLGWRVGASIQLGKLRKQKAVSSEVRRSIKAALGRTGGLVVANWSAEEAEERDSTFRIERAHVNNYPKVTWPSVSSPAPSLISAMDQIDDIPYVEPTDLGSVVLYAFVLTLTDDQRYVFIRKSNPRKFLGSTKWYVDFTAQELKLFTGDILAFDDRFDFLVDSTHLYVLSTKAFEILFRDADALMGLVPGWITRLQGSLSLSDGSSDVLGSVALVAVRQRRKLEAIVARGHLNDVPIARIRERLLARENIEISEHLTNDGRIILSEENVEFMLAFLNEDLFEGELTSVHFQADRKVLASS